MEPTMQPGIDIDPQMLNQVLQNTVAQNAVRTAQLESAVQSLMAENQRLKAALADTQVSTDEDPMPVIPVEIVEG